MFAKMLCMAMTLFVTVHGQYDNGGQIDEAFQELIYNIGMHLAQEPVIQDGHDAKKILLKMYDQIDTVTQIIDLFLEIDDVAQEQNVTTFSQMLDYEKKVHPAMIDAGIIWLQAYQELFKIFVEIHKENCSFGVWCQDAAIILAIEDGQVEDPAYLKLWQAGYKVMLAQYDFEQVIKDL
ncbi:MAG: hypothetical protein ACXWL5_03805 [Candidatus Chromulinivorax sp.]